MKLKIKEDIDVERIKKAAQDIIDFMQNYNPDDMASFEMHLVEETLQACFGDDVYRYINTFIV